MSEKADSIGHTSDITWGALFLKGRKNTLPNLVRQFAKWLTARKNQTKTLEQKLRTASKMWTLQPRLEEHM